MKTDIRTTPGLRAEIRERDRQTCQYCGTMEGTMDVDHIIPWSLGGPSQPHNLVAACHRCNCLKCQNTWIPRNLELITVGREKWRERIIKRSKVSVPRIYKRYGKPPVTLALVMRLEPSLRRRFYAVADANDWSLPRTLEGLLNRWDGSGSTKAS